MRRSSKRSGGTWALEEIGRSRPRSPPKYTALPSCRRYLPIHCEATVASRPPDRTTARVARPELIPLVILRTGTSGVWSRRGGVAASPGAGPRRSHRSHSGGPGRPPGSGTAGPTRFRHGRCRRAKRGTHPGRPTRRGRFRTVPWRSCRPGAGTHAVPVTHHH